MAVRGDQNNNTWYRNVGEKKFGINSGEGVIEIHRLKNFAYLNCHFPHGFWATMWSLPKYIRLRKAQDYTQRTSNSSLGGRKITIVHRSLLCIFSTSSTQGILRYLPYYVSKHRAIHSRTISDKDLNFLVLWHISPPELFLGDSLCSRSIPLHSFKYVMHVIINRHHKMRQWCILLKGMHTWCILLGGEWRYGPTMGHNPPIPSVFSTVSILYFHIHISIRNQITFSVIITLHYKFLNTQHIFQAII